MTTPRELLQRRQDDLRRGYAAVEIPDVVREDIAASYFFTNTTVSVDATGAIDTAATLRNEGARAAFVRFLARVDQAKRRTDPDQTHAVTATAREML